MTFAEAVSLISSLENKGWRLELDRMNEFLRRAKLLDSLGAGTPQFIHIAGTNGKGSVTAFVHSMLLEQGWNAGATFSPYVYDVRERIRVGRDVISCEAFAKSTARLWPIALSMEGTDFDGPTEFEFKTAMGFDVWESSECDWVALEVGLGGRLDATNVVSPSVACIVSIGLDHTAILGDSLEAIAREKAGIIKPGVPVVLGRMPIAAQRVIEEIARENQSEVWAIGREVRLHRRGAGFDVATPHATYRDLVSGIAGAIQPENMAVAVAAIELSGAIQDPDKIGAGTAQASIPGRFQRASFGGKDFLLDGAHNADAAFELSASIRAAGLAEREIVLVTGMLHGHEMEVFYEPLIELVQAVHTVPIDFHRSRTSEEVTSAINSLVPGIASAHSSVDAALTACLRLQGDPLLLVTGSFYLVGEVGRMIGLAPESCP